jgi:DNA repair protein RadC
VTNYKIKNLHKTDRPREKLIKHGPDFLTNSELLGILIGSGYREKNAVQLAQSLLSKHKSKNLSKADYKTLTVHKGIGQSTACRIIAAFELSKRLLVDTKEKTTICSPEDVYRQLKKYTKLKKEHFIGLYLNVCNELIHQETISIGTLSQTLVHPREVFEPAIRHHASSVILVHNHPSGLLRPSSEDKEIAKRLNDSGDLLGIKVTDHLIITQSGLFSFENN